MTIRVTLSLTTSLHRAATLSFRSDAKSAHVSRNLSEFIFASRGEIDCARAEFESVGEEAGSFFCTRDGRTSRWIELLAGIFQESAGLTSVASLGESARVGKGRVGSGRFNPSVQQVGSETQSLTHSPILEKGGSQ